MRWLVGQPVDAARVEGPDRRPGWPVLPIGRRFAQPDRPKSAVEEALFSLLLFVELYPCASDRVTVAGKCSPLALYSPVLASVRSSQRDLRRDRHRLRPCNSPRATRDRARLDPVSNPLLLFLLLLFCHLLFLLFLFCCSSSLQLLPLFLFLFFCLLFYALFSAYFPL